MITEVEEMPAAPAQDSKGGFRFEAIQKLEEIGCCLEALGQLAITADENAASTSDVGYLVRNLADQHKAQLEELFTPADKSE